MYKHCECDHCHNVVETVTITRHKGDRLCKSCYARLLTYIPIQIDAINELLLEVRDALLTIPNAEELVIDEYQNAYNAVKSLLGWYESERVELVRTAITTKLKS